MKYTKEQRLDIGRRIYDGELTRYEAAEEYGISEQTARDYMRHYWDANQLPPKRGVRSCLGLAKTKSIPKTGIPRSSFYNWKKSVEHPPEQKKRLVQSIGLFQEYHGRFPSHGYRWLNAKIRLDKGIVFSDPYAHKCCKIAGIKSLCKHYSYKKAGDPSRTYPNLLLAGVSITPRDVTKFSTSPISTGNVIFSFSNSMRLTR